MEKHESLLDDLKWAQERLTEARTDRDYCIYEAVRGGCTWKQMGEAMGTTPDAPRMLMKRRGPLPCL